MTSVTLEGGVLGRSNLITRRLVYMAAGLNSHIKDASQSGVSCNQIGGQIDKTVSNVCEEFITSLKARCQLVTQLQMSSFTLLHNWLLQNKGMEMSQV